MAPTEGAQDSVGVKPTPVAPFAGPLYTRAYYLLQLIAAVILFVGTAGASLMVMVVLAVIQLALLIWDSIVLDQMLHREPAPA